MTTADRFFLIIVAVREGFFGLAQFFLNNFVFINHLIAG
jgi:hypothetical protein